MLAGWERKGVRVKAYVMTNRRVRLECQYDKTSLRAIIDSRAVTGASFSALFAEVAEHAAPIFDKIIDEVRGRQPTGRSPIDLVAASATPSAVRTSLPMQFVNSCATGGFSK